MSRIPLVGEIWNCSGLLSERTGEPLGTSSGWGKAAAEGCEFEILSIDNIRNKVDIRFLNLGETSKPLAENRLLVGTHQLNLCRFTEGQCVFVRMKGDSMTPATRSKKVSPWTLAEKILPEARLVLLYGPPGTGKTTAGNRIGLKGGTVEDHSTENPGLLVSGTLKPIFNIYNITLTEETPAAELRGHYHMKGGDFVWQDGTGLMPFRKGGRLILNEIDKASGDCLQFCHALLDDPDIAAITLPSGETVRPHSNFSVVATMNGVPGDLPEALRDRFTVRVNITEPHPKAIKSLPKDLQGPCKKGYADMSDRIVTFRTWKSFAHLREVIGEDMAAQAVFDERAGTILNALRIGRGETSKATAYMAPSDIAPDYDPTVCYPELDEYDEDYDF